MGTGNVATQLSLAMYAKGLQIVQIYGRHPELAGELSERVGSEPVSSPELITSEADLYILAVSDRAIAEVAAQLPFRCSWLLHTAGSVPVSVLQGFADHAGVLYPFQTLSKNRILDFEEVPLFVEALNPEDLPVLRDFAGILSAQVFEMSSEQRPVLHMAAVFACNFVNHFYALGAALLEKEKIPFSVLTPLMEETFRKASESGNPLQMQTGPAVRKDREVIEEHIRRLREHPEWQKLYIFVTESIMNMH